MFKIGDKVRADIYPAPVIGRVTKVLKRCVFLDSLDEPGRSMCVLFTALTKLPSTADIGYAVRLH